ncbi:MAG TPA: DNA alkylation repair protein [Vicinamibacterales bacterium]|nr:DNA alkylation repair protein [Vicinamibacterales bacterium]
MYPQPTVASVLAWLERQGTAKNRAGMARYGLPSANTFGVSMATMHPAAKRLGRNQALAEALWKTGWYEARIMCAFVGDPARMTPALMDAWCNDFDSWGVTDTMCFKLFDQSPHAWQMVPKWVKRKGEFQKRAGFVMMACLAAHDHHATDAAFLKCLPMIEKGAADDRNFVKKGVSWAIRHIGHRNARLHAAAVATATRLSRSANATARWVGKDALRDITRPLVLNKVAPRR